MNRNYEAFKLLEVFFNNLTSPELDPIDPLIKLDLLDDKWLSAKSVFSACSKSYFSFIHNYEEYEPTAYHYDNPDKINDHALHCIAAWQLLDSRVPSAESLMFSAITGLATTFVRPMIGFHVSAELMEATLDPIIDFDDSHRLDPLVMTLTSFLGSRRSGFFSGCSIGKAYLPAIKLTIGNRYLMENPGLHRAKKTFLEADLGL